MDDLERSSLTYRSSDSRLATARKSNRLTVLLFAAFASSALIAWLWFLGWGLVTLLRWLGPPR